LSQLDLLYLAQPLVILGATTGLLVLYYRKRLLTAAVMGLSFLAYFVAIAGKVAFQLLIATPSSAVWVGLYFGLQTAILEIGVAYLVARYALRENLIRVEEAPAYGAGLAFWENGILLGALTFPGLIVVILLGGSGLPSGSLGQVLQLMALGTLERGSSILAHFSWGILVVVGAASKKERYLLAALPMGLIDALVPFASSVSLAEFEGIVFALSVLCLTVTYILTRRDWPTFWGAPVPAQRTSSSSTFGPIPSTRYVLSGGSLSPPGRDRARCGKCGAVFAAPRNLFLPHLGTLVLRKCPSCGNRSFIESHVDAPVTWPPANGKPP
jgi:ribosomal protein S27AE